MSDPVCDAFIFCDDVIAEQGTNKYTLVGLFNTLTVGPFPFSQNRFFIHVVVANFLPQSLPSSVMIRVKHPKTGAVIAKASETVNFPDDKASEHNYPRTFLTNLCIQKVTFPEAGKYEIELLVDNENIHTHILVINEKKQVVNPTMPPAKSNLTTAKSNPALDQLLANPKVPDALKNPALSLEQDAAAIELKKFFFDRYSVNGEQVHLESIISALGACAGFGSQIAIREVFIKTGKVAEMQAFTVLGTKNGGKYYFGNMINARVLGDDPQIQVSVWGLIRSALATTGSSILPDLKEISAHCARTIGGASFGIPRLPQKHEPMELPLDVLRQTWPAVRNILAAKSHPDSWGLAAARALQNVIAELRTPGAKPSSNILGALWPWGKNQLDPLIAAKIALEAAIPMSKMDPATIDPASLILHPPVQAKPPEQQAKSVSQPGVMIKPSVFGASFRSNPQFPVWISVFQGSSMLVSNLNEFAARGGLLEVGLAEGGSYLKEIMTILIDPENLPGSPDNPRDEIVKLAMLLGNMLARAINPNGRAALPRASESTLAQAERAKGSTLQVSRELRSKNGDGPETLQRTLATPDVLESLAQIRTPSSALEMLINFKVALDQCLLLYEEFYTEDNLRRFSGAGQIEAFGSLNDSGALQRACLSRFGAIASAFSGSTIRAYFDGISLTIDKYSDQGVLTKSEVRVTFLNPEPSLAFDQVTRVLGDRWQPYVDRFGSSGYRKERAATHPDGNKKIFQRTTRTIGPYLVTCYLILEFQPNGLLYHAEYWSEYILHGPMKALMPSGVEEKPASLPPPTKDGRITVENPLRLLDPTIGFLNLGGEEGARWVEADCQVLAPLFKKALSATGQAPICEVLFIYCALTEEGKIFGADRSLRDFIRDARASIAVVAMDNSMAAYKTCVASGTQENPLLLTPQDERVFDPHYGGWAANIVMTLNRNGDTFAKFFSDLFQAMHNGQTMPMAFASLAPQIPRDHPGINNVPGTLMLSEVSHIIFASN